MSVDLLDVVAMVVIVTSLLLPIHLDRLAR